MFCSHCGKEIDDSAKFCEFCGAKLEPKMPETAGGFTHFKDTPGDKPEAGSPYGAPYGSPAGGTGNPYGAAPTGTGNPYGAPYGNPAGAPNAAGNPYGAPYGNPAGAPYGSPARPPEKKKKKTGLIVLAVLLIPVILFVLLSVIGGFIGEDTPEEPDDDIIIEEDYSGTEPGKEPAAEKDKPAEKPGKEPASEKDKPSKKPDKDIKDKDVTLVPEKGDKNQIPDVSTKKRPEFSDFDWFEEIRNSGTWQGAVQLEDFMDIKGSWKGMIIHNYGNPQAKELLNVTISGDAINTVLTLDWYKIMWNGEAPRDESSNEDFVIKGGYLKDKQGLYFNDGIKILLKDFFSYKGSQYATCYLIDNSGTESLLLLTRP